MHGLFSAAYVPFTQILNFIITRLISYFIFFNFKISCICFLSIITRTHVFINLSNKTIPVMSFVIDYTTKHYIQLSKKLNILKQPKLIVILFTKTRQHYIDLRCKHCMIYYIFIVSPLQHIYTCCSAVS
jgi:hypothetical protein